MVQSVGA